MFGKIEDAPRTADGVLRNPWVDIATEAYVRSLLLIDLEIKRIRGNAMIDMMRQNVVTPVTAPVHNWFHGKLAEAATEGAFENATPDDASDEAAVREAARQLGILGQWGQS